MKIILIVILIRGNRVAKESLKPGDHIYSWRTAYIYAHHGSLYILCYLPIMVYLFIYLFKLSVVCATEVVKCTQCKWKCNFSKIQVEM